MNESIQEQRTKTWNMENVHGTWKKNHLYSLTFNNSVPRKMLLREGFKKKKCGIFRTFQNPPTPLPKCGKKNKKNMV